MQEISSNTFTPQHPLKTAVLFLIFNRSNTTKQVFEVIRKAKLPRLYVANNRLRYVRTDKPGDDEKIDHLCRINIE